jgi:hypothetical protein
LSAEEANEKPAAALKASEMTAAIDKTPDIVSKSDEDALGVMNRLVGGCNRRLVH